MDGAGNLYGTTVYGGIMNNGAAFEVNFGQYAATVSATGSGTVTSSPSGINCPTACTASFSPGTQVILTAHPASAASFEGWGEPCSGTGTCTLTMTASLGVSAAR